MKTGQFISRYSPGSYKELFYMAIPLIALSLSENIMIFFDRIFLAHYSLSALNAMTLSSQAIEIFQYAILAICGTTELFIARLNAKKVYKNVASVTWQMIFFSLLTLPLIILMSRYTGSLVLPEAYQRVGLPYYQLNVFTIPLIGMIAALSGFFIGRGEVYLVFISSVTMNIINLILDIMLIFGVSHHIAAMGAAGAAWSAIISLSLQVGWLFLMFLNKKNRLTFKTQKIIFDLKQFMRSLKIGAPIALSYAGEMVGWFVIIKIVSETTVENFTIVSIGSTLCLVFTFFSDGLYRSLNTIISHHIVHEQQIAVKRSLRAGLIIMLVSLIMIAFPFLLDPDFIMKLFNLDAGSFQLDRSIKFNLIFILTFFLFSGGFWLYASVLTAWYRTKIIMISSISAMWILTIFPIYLLAKLNRLDSNYIWPIVNIYVISSLIVAAVAARKCRGNDMFTVMGNRK